MVFKFYILPQLHGRVGNAAQEHVLDVFVKTPSVREFSISLKALSSTYNVLAKEVIVYSKLVPTLSSDVVAKKNSNSSGSFPLPLPSPIYAEWSRIFECYIVVTRTILSPSGAPYTAIPDWRMRDIGKMRHMMRVIAKFHAATWELKTKPVQFDFASYFPGEVRSAVAWVNGGMCLFFDKKASPAMKTVWAKITQRLQREPLVMSHGDYRPGNMLWKTVGCEDKPTSSPNKSSKSIAPPPAEGIFPDMVATDLELAVVTPYMWDASYAIYIGLPIDLRREHEMSLLTEYTTELVACLKADGRSTCAAVAPGSSEAVALHRVLGLALIFYGWTLAVLGEMPSTEQDASIQGNTAEDGNAWQERMVAMLGDLVGDSTPIGIRSQVAQELGLATASTSLEGDPAMQTLRTFWKDVDALLHARNKK